MTALETHRVSAVCPSCGARVEVDAVGKYMAISRLSLSEEAAHADCDLARLYDALSVAARTSEVWVGGMRFV